MNYIEQTQEATLHKKSKCTATYLSSQKNIQKDKVDMGDTAGEVKTNS